MPPPTYEFDLEHYQQINRDREVWLRQILAALPFKSEISTALDLGCGAGYFSRVLQETGFKVTAMDLQEENLQVCRQRYPGIQFSRIELDAETPVGSYDLVLLFGILYHLRQLAAVGQARRCRTSNRQAGAPALQSVIPSREDGEGPHIRRLEYTC